ncbi:hypothetical protein NM208_g4642 [Fusarium decemcellulare]|uniref:Uncharacterized protein n=1 Tax=Fusarium decemcellulare TaxID=57161 RepID=A0ACC1SK31_9HYPO|nr:hypothetical protein NM208_g4642 [Fusarium decemcellulare]
MESDPKLDKTFAHKTKIAQRCAVSIDTLNDVYAVTRGDFWRQVAFIADMHFDWPVVHQALQDAKATRFRTRRRGVKQTTDWVRWDAVHALESLKALRAKEADGVAGSAAETVAVESTILPMLSLKLEDRVTDTDTIFVKTTPAPAEQKTHVVWIGVPTINDIGDAAIGNPVRVPIFHGLVAQSHSGSHLKCLTEQRLQELERALGSSFVSTNQGEEAYVHQDLATILCAEDTGLITVEIHPWTWAKDMARTGALKDHIDATSDSKVVLYVAYTGAEWTANGLDEFYQNLEPLCAIYNNLRLYPSKTELLAANMKIADIAALDRVARDSSQAEYSWRPYTCFGLGRCTLQTAKDKKMMVKRNFSDSSNHVKLVKGSTSTLLNCYAGERPKAHMAPKDNDEPWARWFHMEYVESLRTFGEYRVYLSGDSVVAVGFSKFEKDTIHIRGLNDDDFYWASTDESKQKQKRQELYDFARYQRRKLLEQHNADTAFESLRLGVRLDIGVSKESEDGQFFVLEITRWWNANYMPARILPDPYTKLSYDYGKALARELSGN